MARRIWTLGAGLALAAVIALALGGLAHSRADAQTPPGTPPAEGQQGRPDRRELMEALANLAGLSPRELRELVQEKGGLLQALESRGVTQQQILDMLTQQALRRFGPAVAEGRISQQQAEQLARQQARRALRRLGGTAPGGR